MSHNIDKIIYINLERRNDRREHIETQLTKYNLIHKTERFNAIDFPDFGIYGCGMSHLSVIKIAKEKGYKNILILEDDFEFLVEPDVFDDLLTQFFDLNMYYNVCMLSYNLEKSEIISSIPFLTHIKEAHTASGYIINSNYYDKLIDLYEEAMPKLLDSRMHWIFANDVVWNNLQLSDTWVCFTTRIGKQMDGYSDNSEAFISYNC
jgi:GR25 family glycosyltransferase involved in LPS biosynthesis